MTALKDCNKCGKQVDMKEITIVWDPEGHSFTWVCGKCLKIYRQRI